MDRNRIILYSSVVGFFGLLVLLNVVSPTDAGPLGILLFFTTLFVVIFGIVSLLMDVFYKMSGKKERMGSKDYLYSVIISFAPIMMLMAKSFGALSIWTVSLILIFLFLVGFLIKKRF